MAAKKKTTTSASRGKKRKWFPIVAPSTFNEASLGESYVAETLY